MPAEAKVSAPGLALAAAIRSATVFHPLDGEATSTVGCRPSGMIEAKSSERVVGQALVDRLRGAERG